MDNNLNYQPNANAYTYISQAQAAYSQYLRLKIELNASENIINTANRLFESFPTQQNFSAVQDACNKKLLVMQQIPQIINTIAINLKEATKQALTYMKMSLESNNKLSIILNDNTFSSIYSFLEQNPVKPYLQALYKQYCINENIPMQISDIEIRARLMLVNTPNFDKLKVIIRGY